MRASALPSRHCPTTSAKTSGSRPSPILVFAPFPPFLPSPLSPLPFPLFHGPAPCLRRLCCPIPHRRPPFLPSPQFAAHIGMAEKCFQEIERRQLREIAQLEQARGQTQGATHRAERMGGEEAGSRQGSGGRLRGMMSGGEETRPEPIARSPHSLPPGVPFLPPRTPTDRTWPLPCAPGRKSRGTSRD